MVAAIKQLVTVQRGGLIQVRSSRLKAGSQAEVIVLLPEPTKRRANKSAKSNGRKHSAASRVGSRIAKMTKEVRGDIAEAHRIRNAISDGREMLIPWEQVKRELGLT